MYNKLQENPDIRYKVPKVDKAHLKVFTLIQVSLRHLHECSHLLRIPFRDFSGRFGWRVHDRLEYLKWRIKPSARYSFDIPSLSENCSW
jgi:hypothetical protein